MVSHPKGRYPLDASISPTLVDSLFVVFRSFELTISEDSERLSENHVLFDIEKNRCLIHNPTMNSVSHILIRYHLKQSMNDSPIRNYCLFGNEIVILISVSKHFFSFNALNENGGIKESKALKKNCFNNIIGPKAQ